MNKEGGPIRYVDELSHWVPWLKNWFHRSTNFFAPSPEKSHCQFTKGVKALGNKKINGLIFRQKIDEKEIRWFPAEKMKFYPWFEMPCIHPGSTYQKWFVLCFIRSIYEGIYIACIKNMKVSLHACPAGDGTKNLHVHKGLMPVWYDYVTADQIAGSRKLFCTSSFWVVFLSALILLVHIHPTHTKGENRGNSIYIILGVGTEHWLNLSSAAHDWTEGMTPSLQLGSWLADRNPMRREGTFSQAPVVCI